MEDNKKTLDSQQEQQEMTYEDAFSKLRQFIIKTKKEEQEAKEE